MNSNTRLLIFLIREHIKSEINLHSREIQRLQELSSDYEYEINHLRNRICRISHTYHADRIESLDNKCNRWELKRDAIIKQSLRNIRRRRRLLHLERKLTRLIDRD